MLEVPEFWKEAPHLQPTKRSMHSALHRPSALFSCWQDRIQRVKAA